MSSIHGWRPKGADEIEQARVERACVLRIRLLAESGNILAVLPPDAGLEVIDEQSNAALKKVAAATANAPHPIVCFAEEWGWEKMHAAIEAGVSAHVEQDCLPSA